MKAADPIEILMAEDSSSDQAITQEAIRHSKLANRLHIVDTGEEALQFLRREGKFAGAPRPDLILLDLNMPRKNGLEVLAEIKAHSQWKHIPVVILSTSKAETDVNAAYRLQANCYVIKPLDFDQFVEIVHAIENFWFSVVRLPTKDAHESHHTHQSPVD